MKALSLRQPWAHFVVNGLVVGNHDLYRKDIENRRWRANLRGEVLIHAAKGMTMDEYEGAVDFAADALGIGDSLDAQAGVFPQPKALVRGAIIGRTRIVDVIPPCTHCEGLIERAECNHRRWHMPAQFGFILADTHQFGKPIPWLGALGFFDTPFDRDGNRAP